MTKTERTPALSIVPSPMASIAVVERETGLGKDTLRVWERRYGFPAPERDAGGDRLYPREQVDRLRLIKRLMDMGHRPGKLLSMPPEQLAALTPRRQPGRATAAALATPDDGLAQMLDFIRNHDVPGYQQAMQQRLARHGLQRFIRDTLAPLTRAVGEAWERGSFEVYEEHLFSELTKRLLRQAIDGLPGARRPPRIVLTTLPDEPHALGLLMVEVLFALEGAECIPLGVGMPMIDIVRAAQAHRADVVALSFSSAFPHRQLVGLLRQLRQDLPAPVAIWAGGSGVARVAAMEGIELLNSLDDALSALARWRAARA